MSENEETIAHNYFVCIFNFINYYKITNIKSKDKSIDIEFNEINNPEEKKYKTYLMWSKLNFNKNITKEIQIEFYDTKKENKKENKKEHLFSDINDNKINTFESKIEFEKNKSKFLYEINYKTGILDFKNDGIKQNKYNFFKFNEFNKFINKIESQEKREKLKKLLIEESINNFEKIKTKNENEIEFFYLLLLMKETNSEINFSLNELKSKIFIFPKKRDYIENIEDFKNYLLDKNFKNNDENYKIIKLIFLCKYYKEDFVIEITKENFDKNFNIF